MCLLDQIIKCNKVMCVGPDYTMQEGNVSVGLDMQ
jgi:hypothetical protein